MHTICLIDPTGGSSLAAEAAEATGEQLLSMATILKTQASVGRCAHGAVASALGWTKSRLGRALLESSRGAEAT